MIAILITIMVLELHQPDGTTWAALRDKLSLIPFTTAWMSEHDFRALPTATYGIVLLAAAIAYYILQLTLLRAAGDRSLLTAAVGRDLKGKLSPVLYCVGIALCFTSRWLGVAAYVVVALTWLLPDRRVERVITERGLPDPEA